MKVLPKFDDNLPFKILTPIFGEPKYEKINHLTQELYYNASSIPSTLGGCKHGHLGMLMKNQLYKSISKNIL